MENRCALVVDQRTVHTAVVLQMPEAIPKVDRALIGLGERPSTKLAQHVLERVLATGLLRIERREILGEAFAQPLLVVVLPAHCLPPPLVGQLMSHKEVGIVAKRRRVVAPRQRCLWRRRIDHGEVPRTMSAGRLVLGDRDSHRRIRCVANDRCIEVHDVFDRGDKLSCV